MFKRTQKNKRTVCVYKKTYVCVCAGARENVYACLSSEAERKNTI